jgi:hypothetical protein
MLAGWADVDEIGDAALFLASDDCRRKANYSPTASSAGSPRKLAQT